MGPSLNATTRAHYADRGGASHPAFVSTSLATMLNMKILILIAMPLYIFLKRLRIFKTRLIGNFSSFDSDCSQFTTSKATISCSPANQIQEIIFTGSQIYSHGSNTFSLPYTLPELNGLSSLVNLTLSLNNLLSGQILLTQP